MFNWCLNAATPPTTPSKQDYLRIATEVETNLQNEILSKWFPSAVDEQSGGFHENYAVDWTRTPGDNKSLVYQARLTWTAAQAALRFPARKEFYLSMTRRGARELMEKLWDQEHGGFFWTVDPQGRPAAQGKSGKQVYGIAFGIYALAASYEATRDADTLSFAKKAFQWFDLHAHDNTNLGYYEVLNLDGSVAPNGPSVVGAGPNQKSMNTSIHVLEALTGLYKIWPDPAVKKRLKEMFDVNLNRIYSEPGFLTMFFNADWSRLPGKDSFGHDVEAGFLLVEAAEALRQDEARAWSAARHLMDHSLQYGWDNERGGLYDSAAMTPQGVVTGELATEKIWWVEAEQLNALLLLHGQFGKETSKYWDAFSKQWQFISRYQVDHQHGGWFHNVSAEGKPAGRPYKSDAWTECYHQGRAMLTVSEKLRSLASR